MALEKRSILVVEDDSDLAELETMLLEKEGFVVERASHGLEALERVAEHMPALILLDLKMPVMGGHAFAETFRRLYGRAAPMVVVTAADSARRRAREAGADDWVSKPFSPRQLLAAVGRNLPPATSHD